LTVGKKTDGAALAGGLFALMHQLMQTAGGRKQQGSEQKQHQQTGQRRFGEPAQAADLSFQLHVLLA